MLEHSYLNYGQKIFFYFHISTFSVVKMLFLPPGDVLNGSKTMLKCTSFVTSVNKPTLKAHHHKSRNITSNAIYKQKWQNFDEIFFIETWQRITHHSINELLSFTQLSDWQAAHFNRVFDSTRLFSENASFKRDTHRSKIH